MGQAELFQEQLIAEATAGRATSMNLIGSLCEHYNPEEVVERGFVDEVLRSGDGDVSVRAEGAVALSCIAKVAPVEHVYRMVSLL
jgi:serine/threonine-protein phosphatase 4 regulatory subunit 1